MGPANLLASRIPRWVAALAVALALPFAAMEWLDGPFGRPPPDPADPRDPGQLAVPAFAVSNAEGRRVGTLAVEYPRSMRENESKPLVLRYEVAPAWREAFARRSDMRIEAAVSGVRLDVVPEPTSHVFRNEMLLRRGFDSRGWEVVPSAEGDYVLRLRLEVAPAGFAVGPLDANGAALPAGEDQRLPVTVYTRYSVSQATVDIVKFLLGLAGFAVTFIGFPYILRLIRKWRGLPEPAPAEARGPAGTVG